MLSFGQNCTPFATKVTVHHQLAMPSEKMHLVPGIPQERVSERGELTDKRGWPWEAVRQARPRDPFGTEEEAGGRGPLTSAL